MSVDIGPDIEDLNDDLDKKGADAAKGFMLRRLHAAPPEQATNITPIRPAAQTPIDAPLMPPDALSLSGSAGEMAQLMQLGQEDRPLAPVTPLHPEPAPPTPMRAQSQITDMAERVRQQTEAAAVVDTPQVDTPVVSENRPTLASNTSDGGSLMRQIPGSSDTPRRSWLGRLTPWKSRQTVSTATAVEPLAPEPVIPEATIPPEVPPQPSVRVLTDLPLSGTPGGDSKENMRAVFSALNPTGRPSLLTRPGTPEPTAPPTTSAEPEESALPPIDYARGGRVVTGESDRRGGLNAPERNRTVIPERFRAFLSRTITQETLLAGGALAAGLAGRSLAKWAGFPPESIADAVRLIPVVSGGLSALTGIAEAIALRQTANAAPGEAEARWQTHMKTMRRIRRVSEAVSIVMLADKIGSLGQSVEHSFQNALSHAETPGIQPTHATSSEYPVTPQGTHIPEPTSTVVTPTPTHEPTATATHEPTATHTPEPTTTAKPTEVLPTATPVPASTPAPAAVAAPVPTLHPDGTGFGHGATAVSAVVEHGASTPPTAIDTNTDHNLPVDPPHGGHVVVPAAGGVTPPHAPENPIASPGHAGLLPGEGAPATPDTPATSGVSITFNGETHQLPTSADLHLQTAPIEHVTSPTGHVVSGDIHNGTLTIDGVPWDIHSQAREDQMIALLQSQGVQVDGNVHGLISDMIQDATTDWTNGKLDDHSAKGVLFHYFNDTISERAYVHDHLGEAIQSLSGQQPDVSVTNAPIPFPGNQAAISNQPDRLAA